MTLMDKIKQQVAQILNEYKESNIPTESAATYITSILDYAKYDNFDYVKVQCAEILKLMFSSFSKYVNISIDEEFVIKQINDFEKYAARYNMLKNALQNSETAAERTKVLYEHMFDFFSRFIAKYYSHRVLVNEENILNE